MLKKVLTQTNLKVINVIGEFDPEDFPVVDISFLSQRQISSDMARKIEDNNSVIVLSPNSLDNRMLTGVIKEISGEDKFIFSARNLYEKQTEQVVLKNLKLVIFTPDADWFNSLDRACQLRIFVCSKDK